MKRREEAESSAGEDAGTSGGVEGMQISQVGILSILPIQLSCTRGKIQIVLDVVVLTIS